MNNATPLALAFLVGGALGALFFGGLWWTVRQGVSSNRPALWFFPSLLLRMAIVLTGFYFVAGARWERLAMCLLGFLGARVIVLRLTREPADKLTRSAKEAHHAP